MLRNRKSSRFYSVKGFFFFAMALALLMSVTAFASGTSRFAFLDGASDNFGLQSNVAPAVSVSLGGPCVGPGMGDIVTVSIASNIPAPGATLAVPVMVGDTTNCNLISYDMNVDYNSAVLQPAGGATCAGTACYTISGTRSSSAAITPNTGNSGHFIVSAFQAGPMDGAAGTLIILNFNVVGTMGQSSPLTFADYTDPGPAFHSGFTFNEGDPAPDLGSNSGSAQIPLATPTITNTATPTPTGTNTPTATSTATNTSTPTGTATNTNTPTPTPLCAQVDIDDKVTTTGSAVFLSITTTNTTGLIPPAFSTDTHVTFDPSLLQLDTAFPGSQLGVTLGAVAAGNGSNMLVNQPSPGLLVISLFSTNQYTGAGSLVDIHFIALGSPGSFTPVYFTPWTQPPFSSHDADGFRYNEDFPSTCLTDGSVTISGTVNGVITYGNSMGAPSVRHIPNTTVDGIGAPPVTGTSNSTGNYFLSGFGPGSYNIVPSRGSAVAPNTHGSSINAYDAAITQQRVAGIPIPWTTTQTFVADVTGNGQVTSEDATGIASWVVSLPSNFFQSGSWAFAPSSVNHPFVFNQTDSFTGYLFGEVSGNWCDPLEFGPGQCTSFGYTTAGVRPAAGPQKDATVVARNVEAAIGSSIVVPVDVTSVANKGIISYQFDLRYDPTVIQPIGDGVSLAGTVSNRLAVVTNTLTPGLIRVAVYGAYPIGGSGVLFNFHFTAVGDVFRTSPIKLDNFFFNDGNIPTNVTSSEVRLTTAVGD